MGIPLLQSDAGAFSLSDKSHVTLAFAKLDGEIFGYGVIKFPQNVLRKSSYCQK